MENKQEKSIEEIENEEILKWAHFLYSIYKKDKERNTHKEPDKT